MQSDGSPTVVAICGSLRDASKTRIALREVLDAASDAGAETELIDLREYDLPVFDADDRDAGDAPDLKRTVERADAVVFGTPNYHGSFSAPLKNALDYCGRDELAGSTVGLLEVAGGDYPKSAMMHLRTVARTLNAWTLPLEVGIPAAYDTVGDDGIEDPDIESRVRELGAQLVDYAGVDAYPEVAGTPAEAPLADDD
ncbi:NADPH-dependent FMN reductase [Salinarchaeum sp. Harcht-Bsk1]|uniref:NADPH-dependent FMN reductase n=1 Tax=Salinarchaeum sp. Harcht-Bsk1 TaxID=1333523 RepID=UPI0003424493|nr:NAD(P)H-dependent oxidoreductase [Salinarchaeum sp. Harcht-Bsk1]AGN00653.1 NADPH-dependent FMN reductase [Salinarchaeum sp. Harcht-Bsk1]